jgi:hypothetical protein
VHDQDGPSLKAAGVDFNFFGKRFTVGSSGGLGLLTLLDAESGEQLLVDTHDAGFRRRFAQRAAQREQQLRAALTNAGVDTLELATDGALLDALVRFIELRRQRVRAASGGGLPAHLRNSA